MGTLPELPVVCTFCPNALVAFAHARSANVAMIALVSNSVDAAREPFHTDGHGFRTGVLAVIARGAHAFVKTAPEYAHETDRSDRSIGSDHGALLRLHRYRRPAVHQQEG
jgi:hypothetical protein